MSYNLSFFASAVLCVNTPLPLSTVSRRKWMAFCWSAQQQILLSFFYEIVHVQSCDFFPENKKFTIWVTQGERSPALRWISFFFVSEFVLFFFHSFHSSFMGATKYANVSVWNVQSARQYSTCPWIFFPFTWFHPCSCTFQYKFQAFTAVREFYHLVSRGLLKIYHQ